GEKVRWVERTLHPETGEERYREHRSSPIKDEYGEVIGVVGLTQDITDRKNLEQSLVESRKKGLNLIRELKRAEKLRTLFLRSEEHTSELQSRFDLVCRLLLEKKKKTNK